MTEPREEKSAARQRTPGKGTTGGRTVAIGLLCLIFGLLGFVVWLAMTNRGGQGTDTGRRPPPSAPNAKHSHASSSSGADPSSDSADGQVHKTISDRRARDELRKRILEGWAAQGEGETAQAARAGRFPSSETADGGLSKSYIQKVVREDFVPMAKGCYEELLSRRDAAAGRIDVEFKIVGDEKTGGILEDVSIANDGGLADERLDTCLRESMLSLVFEPPPKGGWVTVKYPFEMHPDAPLDQ